MPSADDAARAAGAQKGEDVQAESLRREIDALGPWFHNLHLPGGVQTLPDHFLGGDFPRFKWQEIAGCVPADLSGWRVLDVGCNAGFYSFELARRGASVLAIDSDERYLAQARWAARLLDAHGRIEFRQLGVYEIARVHEQFDLVWFMGVFYHLRYPLLALDLLARRTRRLMVFQTLTMPGAAVYEDTADHPITNREPLLDPGWPKMAFIERRFSGDATNWWVANHAGVEAMLRSSGLRVVQRPAHEIYFCEPDAQTDATAAERRHSEQQLESVVGAMDGV
jgi:tRNA (mo5U34)-methyltransferase